MSEGYDGLVAQSVRHRPEAFVVLGSGLGDAVSAMEPLARCAFASIPGLPRATAAGHRGELVLGRWGGKVVLASVGRLHYYEGHSWDVVTAPVRAAAGMGARVALLTNAAGGIRDDLEPGRLMPLAGQMEWNLPHPWRRPAQASPYSPRLLALLASAGGASSAGVYASVTGPSYETPAEIRALRSQGADAVGMSTTAEARAAVAAGMEVAAVSLITNRAAGLSPATLSHEEVMAVGRQAGRRMAELLRAAIERL